MNEVGIYCYRDLKNNGKIVYIGKDVHINKNKRHKNHFHPSRYNAQIINRVLQNNPERYKYEVLKQFNSEEFNKNLLNALEIIYIKRYNPKFNFTVGGEGITGFKHSDETKQKISAANKGKKHSVETKNKLSELMKGRDSPFKNKKHSEEAKKKISESAKGRIPWNKGKKLGNNKYAKIVKNGLYGEKHHYSIPKQRYSIYRNGKIIKTSVNPSKLLEWFTKTYPTEILQIKTGDNNNRNFGKESRN